MFADIITHDIRWKFNSRMSFRLKITHASFSRPENAHTQKVQKDRIWLFEFTVYNRKYTCNPPRSQNCKISQNIFITLCSKNWRERLFRQNSKTLSSWREQDKRQNSRSLSCSKFWREHSLRMAEKHLAAKTSSQQMFPPTFTAG